MVTHGLQHPFCGLFAGMGLGKTATALTIADTVLNDTCEVSRVLIIAPKKVAQSVWEQEARNWSHLQHLRFSKILGTERQRKKALQAKADIYIINRENTPWLVALSAGRFRFDFIIVDESSSFKNHDSLRFKALKTVLPALKRMVLLTGTPMPNSFLDLWSQIFLLDRGARLGERFTGFRDKYFEKDPYRPFVWKLRSNSGDNWAEKEIAAKISDICISLQEKDYLQLPERIDRIVELELTEVERKAYERFEKDEVLKLADKEITAVNAAGLTNKLLQFANGAVYDEDKTYHEVHVQKLDRLEEILEAKNGVVLIEWAERLGFVPDGATAVRIDYLDEATRRITITEAAGRPL